MTGLSPISAPRNTIKRQPCPLSGCKLMKRAMPIPWLHQRSLSFRLRATHRSLSSLLVTGARHSWRNGRNIGKHNRRQVAVGLLMFWYLHHFQDCIDYSIYRHTVLFFGLTFQHIRWRFFSFFFLLFCASSVETRLFQKCRVFLIRPGMWQYHTARVCTVLLNARGLPVRMRWNSNGVVHCSSATLLDNLQQRVIW